MENLELAAEQTQEQEPPREFSPEIEAIREERTGLVKKIFSHRLTNAAFELTPGLDVVTLASEAAYGKTMSGKKLEGREKMYYAVCAGMIATAYAFYIAGMPNEFKAARVTAGAIAAKTLGPNMLRELLSAVKEKVPAIVPLFEKSAEFIKDQQPLLEEMGRNVETFLAANPDLFPGGLQ